MQTPVKLVSQFERFDIANLSSDFFILILVLLRYIYTQFWCTLRNVIVLPTKFQVGKGKGFGET